MAITNRALDISQQKEVIRKAFSPAASGPAAGLSLYGGLVAGSTMLVGQVPFQSTLKAVQVCADAMTNSLVLSFLVARFIPGAGITYLSNVMASLAITVFGTSGAQSVSLPAAGSSLLTLLANDMIYVTPTGAAGTVTNATIDIVVAALNDVKQTFGSST